MTQNDLDTGRLVLVVGIAPVKPAEFVVLRIGLWAAGAPESTETRLIGLSGTPSPPSPGSSCVEYRATGRSEG